jgi:hypothetical protein
MGRISAVVTAALILVFIVVAAALREPIPPAFTAGEGAPRPAGTISATPTSEIIPELARPEWIWLDLGWAGAALVGLVVAGFVVVVVQAVLRIRRSRRHHLAAVVLDPGLDADLEREARIPALLRGVGAARASLREHVVAGDAVIAAWMELEAAAHESGLDRHPAQTPTEFTATVLEATGADPDATGELLALYHRARFSNAPVAEVDVDRAGDCLARLAASWPTPTRRESS